MAFLSDDELEAVKVDQFIFHVVGKEEDFQLLDEVEAGEGAHIDWFLARIKGANAGNVFDFLPGSGVLNLLLDTENNPQNFADNSRKIAELFQASHTGATSKGALIVMTMSTSTAKFHALIKYDHEDVLQYLSKTQGEKVTATLNRVHDNFVRKNEAMQKACLIKITPEGGEIAVRDRSALKDISKYLLSFLQARRRHTLSGLTTKLADAATTAVKQHAAEVGPTVMKDLRRRIYDTVQNTKGFDPEKPEEFLIAIVGAIPEGSGLPKSFEKALTSQKIRGEAFDFAKDAIPKPRSRRITTEEGIRIMYPKEYENLVRTNARDGKTFITIETNRVVEDDDIPETIPRPR